MLWNVAQKTPCKGTETQPFAAVNKKYSSSEVSIICSNQEKDFATKRLRTRSAFSQSLMAYTNLILVDPECGLSPDVVTCYDSSCLPYICQILNEFVFNSIVPGPQRAWGNQLSCTYRCQMLTDVKNSFKENPAVNSNTLEVKYCTILPCHLSLIPIIF